MKKLILILLISISAFSQNQKVDKIEITANNVNGYLVESYKNKTSKEIYDALKKWTQYNIKKADYAITSDIENEYLAFNINGVGEIRYKESKMWLWKLNLRVEARIKDNKLRLDVYVNRIAGQGNDDIPITGGMNSLFKSDGTPKKSTETYRIGVNRVLNEFVSEVITSINGNTDYKKEEW